MEVTREDNLYIPYLPCVFTTHWLSFGKGIEWGGWLFLWMDHTAMHPRTPTLFLPFKVHDGLAEHSTACCPAISNTERGPQRLGLACTRLFEFIPE